MYTVDLYTGTLDKHTKLETKQFNYLHEALSYVREKFWNRNIDAADIMRGLEKSGEHGWARNGKFAWLRSR